MFSSWHDPDPSGLRRREPDEPDVDGLVVHPSQDEPVEHDIAGAGVQDLVAENEDGADTSVTVAKGNDTTCTITNTRKARSITVEKTVSATGPTVRDGV